MTVAAVLTALTALAQAQEAPAPPAAAPPPSVPGAARPGDAGQALAQAAAAYELGDMKTVIESARYVVDGDLPARRLSERTEALRLLGIGLTLTNRSAGAEPVFFELLRLRPDMRLDPITTRPEAVALFERVRAQHAEELRRAVAARPHKNFAWNFLPPAGQFQNSQRAKGWTFAAIELLALGGAIATRQTLASWEMPGHTFGSHTDDARTLKTLNGFSVTLLVGALAIGIIDGITNY